MILLPILKFNRNKFINVALKNRNALFLQNMHYVANIFKTIECSLKG